MPKHSFEDGHNDRVRNTLDIQRAQTLCYSASCSGSKTLDTESSVSYQTQVFFELGTFKVPQIVEA